MANLGRIAMSHIQCMSMSASVGLDRCSRFSLAHVPSEPPVGTSKPSSLVINRLYLHYQF